MQLYCNSLTQYSRLKTREVKIGDLLLGNFHPIRLQTMTTTDTMDTIATVEQSIRCIEAGAELVRFTLLSLDQTARAPPARRPQMSHDLTRIQRWGRAPRQGE